MKLNAKVLIFDCFGVLVSRQPSSERLFKYAWQNKAKGSKIGVLSNVTQYQFNQLFSKEEQEELFDFLVLSGEVGFSKPSKEIFEIAIDKSETCSNEIYFFDDSLQNVEAAKKLGINAFLYQNWNEFSKEFKEE